jgi:ADP-ribose pyrophosphatase YjhB (NUDIX family)/nicotinic acid mononucleotide adenylyltransferase
MTVKPAKAAKLTNALVIGRFQPPCKHHVKVLEEAASQPGIERLLVGIGVAPKLDKRNFLTGDEVEELLKPILDGVGKPYVLRQVPDINNPPEYCAHVERLFPGMDETNTVLFTDNAYTSDCFTQHGHHYAVREPTPKGVRGTDVRHAMSHRKDWEPHVPGHVARYLRKHAGIWRLQQLTFKCPPVTVDMIIEHQDGVVLIERGNDPYKGLWAIPGGYVDDMEALEKAAVREAKEETSLDYVGLRFMGYRNSTPAACRRSLTNIFVGRGEGVMKADDDARNAKVFPLDKLPPRDKIAFDHYDILQDYKQWRKEHGPA